MDIVKISSRARDTYGKKFFHPECGLSKLLAKYRKRDNLNLENIEALLNLGYKVEYHGDRVKELDDLGAEYKGQ